MKKNILFIACLLFSSVAMAASYVVKFEDKTYVVIQDNKAFKTGIPDPALPCPNYCDIQNVLHQSNSAAAELNYCYNELNMVGPKFWGFEYGYYVISNVQDEICTNPLAEGTVPKR